MRFHLIADTDNAAFEEGELGPELARCLRAVARRVERGAIEGPVVDSNGNTVGRFDLGPWPLNTRHTGGARPV